MTRTKAELDFIAQQTRVHLVSWADHEVSFGSVPHEISGEADCPDRLQTYLEYALDKGWLTKRVPRRLTAKGWSTAAAFLKR